MGEGGGEGLEAFTVTGQCGEKAITLDNVLSGFSFLKYKFECFFGGGANEKYTDRLAVL